MKLGGATLAILHICTHSSVEAACNADDHHPLNGGYFVEGVAGFEGSTKQHRTHRLLDAWNHTVDDKSKPINATWVKGG